MKNSELRLPCIGPFLFLLLNAGNIYYQHLQADKKEHKSSPSTFSPLSHFSKGSLHQAHCFHTTGVSVSHRVIGLGGTTESHQFQPAAPRNPACCSCINPHRCVSKLSLEASSKEESMTPKQCFPVVYYHCLWESFLNILSKFAPLQFKPIFVLSLVLMSKQLSSSLPIWKLLHYMPSVFSRPNKPSQPNHSPSSCTMEGPGSPLALLG